MTLTLWFLLASVFLSLEKVLQDLGKRKNSGAQVQVAGHEPSSAEQTTAITVIAQSSLSIKQIRVVLPGTLPVSAEGYNCPTEAQAVQFSLVILARVRLLPVKDNVLLHSQI